MTRRSSGGGALWIALAFVAALSAAPVWSQTDRSAYLIQLMGTSSSFRVRAQAALSLGGMGPSAPATQALITALRDDEATVRAAAAQSLGRIGDSSALGPLHGIEHDSESAVAQAATTAIASIGARGSGGSAPPTTGTGGGAPSGPARFYVGVGDPGSTVSGIDPALLAAARAAAVSTITPMSGIVVAPQGESATAARAAIRARSLTGFFLDISITDLTTRPDGSIHVAVSVVVQDYPSHNIRSMLNAAATASGASERALIQAAVQSALRNLSQAMGS